MTTSTRTRTRTGTGGRRTRGAVAATALVGAMLVGLSPASALPQVADLRPLTATEANAQADTAAQLEAPEQLEAAARDEAQGSGAQTVDARAAATCLPAGGARVPEATATGAVVVQGHGWGHSMGMSQYGAQGAALLGCDAGTILRTYYPGLRPAMLSLAPNVLIDMLTDGGTAGWSAVRAEGGPVTWVRGTVRVVQPAGSEWAVRRSGDGLSVRTGTATTAPAVAGLTAVAGEQVRAEHPGVVVRVRTYTSATALRLERRANDDHTRFRGSSRGLEVREVMTSNERGRAVTKYLQGLAEMPLSWEVVTHEAQVVAARTYLLGRYSAAEDGYVILPTPAHQNWTGASQEEQDARYGNHLRQAVSRTSDGGSGVVLVDGAGRLARDVLYTSSHGGWSETNTFVYGTPRVGHLSQVDDSRWDLASANPYRSWAAGLSYAQVAAAFGFSLVTRIDAAPQGTPGRTAVMVTGVRNGTSGTFPYSGSAARTALQRIAPVVRSPGMTFRRSTAGVPLVGDWDGDGRDTPGWYSDGRVFLQAADGSLTSYVFGGPGHVPIVGDWDGDGKDSVGTFYSGVWHLRNARSSGPVEAMFAFGSVGDVPVVGRWPGSARTSIGVVRGNRWYLRPTASAGPHHVTFAFGRVGWRPLAGDWDGNGTDTPGVVTGNQRYLSDQVPPGVVSPPFGFGSVGDAQLAGDWDGNGTDTPGMVRGSTMYRSNVRTGVPAIASVPVPR